MFFPFQRSGNPVVSVKVYLLSALFCVISAPLSGLFAQTPPAKFPEEPNEFVDKLGEFMTLSKRPDMEEAYSVFKKQYRSGLYSDRDIRAVIVVANILADQKMGAFPYFKNYINAVSSAKNNPDSLVFQDWHGFAQSTLAAIEKGKSKPIGQFLEFSVDLMEQSALKTGEGGSVTWKVKGGKWSFKMLDKVPYLECADIDLIAKRKQDSIVVFKTSGKYFPYDGVWRGQGGQVSWKDAGLDSTVFAVLSAYKVDANRPIFTCDSAILYYPLFFPGRGLPGKLEHNIVVDSKSSAQFPRFESFDKTLQINKIGEGIEYTGGFLLRGSSVYGYGNRNSPARMTVYNKKRERVFYGTGPLFIMKREVSVVGEGINARLYMDGDSLFHPQCNFRLDIPKQVVTLERGDKGSERNPFFSSFYNMNLNTDKVAWHLNRDSLEIGARAGVKGLEQTVTFESSNHYRQVDFDRMQHIAVQNPIMTLYNLLQESDKDSLGNKGRTIKDNVFAMRISEVNRQAGGSKTVQDMDNSSIQSLLAQMVAEGYINYYFDRHEIEVRDKLVHYALASQGKSDYDAIKIESTSAKANARLDLNKKETQIFEVKKITLSDRQRVAFLPRERELTLLKNRDMLFAGRLYAGFALFQGRDMRFNYDKFQVEFDSVQYLDFYLPTGAKDPKTLEPQATSMNSTIERLSGVLLVDAPNNKSGKENMGIFPSLQSKKNSFVYYDKPETQKRAYTRDSFYFKLDPFSFNGLDDYDKERLRFKGEMTPATIFPPFKETIVVREEDKSFGFIHNTPPTGYSMYTNRGQYRGSIDLSNKGFLGKGKLEYLTADIESEDLVFKPKQTTGTAKKFFLEEDREGDVKLPQAKGENVSVNWLPFRDSLYVESKSKDFELFKASGYTHKGVLVLTPTGLKGRGQFEWSEGKLSSKQISYGPFQASSDTANLEIKSLDGKNIGLDTKNVGGELDFDKQRGEFKSNSSDANTFLPLDKYKTSMTEFYWDMKQKVIEFKALENKPAVFISTDKGQDSLRFEGKTAIYDMKTDVLKIGGVKVIKTSDAFVYPADTASVFIQPGGKMRQLTNARISVDTATKYHNINRATVDILGKKVYKATGYYQYNIPGYNQEVFFNNIVGQTTGVGAKANDKNVLTTAEGDIDSKNNFRMDVKTLFKGKMILKGNQPNMRFEGFAQLDADKLPGRGWFRVLAEVDKNNPVIRIKNATNDGTEVKEEEEELVKEETDEQDKKADEEEEEEGDEPPVTEPVKKEEPKAEPKEKIDLTKGIPVVTGFYLSKATKRMYPRILTPPYNRVDRAIMDCQHVYKYEASSDRFIFGDSVKVVANSLNGRRMIFDNRVGTVQADGPITLGSGLKYMKITAAGRLKSDYNTATDSTGFLVTGEFMTGMEIKMPKNLLDIISNDIKANGFDAPGILFNNNAAFYQPALREFVSDEKDWTEVNAALQTNYALLPRKDDKFSIFLGRHPVKWNNDYESFISMEDKIPVISIGGEPVSKTMTVYVEYKMTRQGDDRFYFHITVGSGNWYYIGYKPEEGATVLFLMSNNENFTNAAAALKEKDRKFKMDDGGTYQIEVGNNADADAFVRRVKEGRSN